MCAVYEVAAAVVVVVVVVLVFCCCYRNKKDDMREIFSTSGSDEKCLQCLSRKIRKEKTIWKT
jgi:hypothetical protein